ncbi:MAG: 4Fe-4S binding protein [Planctomycetota bacterium]|nr:4Fe-4S binding protein [Planctomycetota bacterium]
MHRLGRMMARIPWRWWRRFTQAVFLVGFLWLFRHAELRGDDVPGYVNLPFRLDPLIAASAMLAAKALIATLLLSLIVVALTIVVGRAFCGWICPLGTLLDWLGPIARLFRKRTGPGGRRWRPIRYWLLIAILIGAVLGLPLVGYFDPFSLLQQGMTFAIDPALRSGADAGFGWLYFNASESVTDVSEPVYAFLKEHILAVERTAYIGAGIATGILIVIFLLERVQPRFWCRNLCPLGAMLGVIARFAPFGRKPMKACPGCGECAHTCRMGAFDEHNRLEPQACTVCMDCVDSCPHRIAQFLWFLPKKRAATPATRQGAPIDLSRRSFIGACAVGAALPAGYAAARATGIVPGNVALIRPPGALLDDDFLDLCVRCGQCMKVCITNGLQPVIFEAGPTGVFTPRLIPRTGYCEYNCTLCGEICPTGAIRPLPLEEKQQIKIGKAVFDEDLCLPYAESEPCIVCEEHCPIPEKAIKLTQVEVEVDSEDGPSTIVLQQPSVDEDLCIGCGICEHVCPLEGLAGVRIESLRDEAARE